MRGQVRRLVSESSDSRSMLAIVFDAEMPDTCRTRLTTLINHWASGSLSSNANVMRGAPAIPACQLPSLPDLTLDDETDPPIQAASEVCVQLAQAIVRDGEGATRFVTVAVEGGESTSECLQVAYTIAHSPLVKTALFAGDPNWGRILAAVGRAGVCELDLDKIQIYLGDVCIVQDGGRAPGYTEAAGQQVMDKDEITIRVVLSRGDCSEEIWTCDLSYDYVKINAEYRT